MMLFRYDAAFGYDAVSHQKYIEWFVNHSGLPDIMYSRETHQAPLYYFTAAQILRHGGTWQAVAAYSVILGCLRLVAFEAGLLILIPTSRIARCVAIGLAAVIPASIHLDGMINCEAMVGFTSALMMLCAVLMFGSEGGRRIWAGAALGLASGISLLSKISALAIVGAIGTAVLIELLRRSGASMRVRARRLVAPILALGIMLMSTGWYFAHNAQAYGKPIVSSYDGRDREGMTPYRDIPLLKRRSLDFLYGWTLDIYRQPQWPAGYQPRAHLVPVLVASTFADYYHYRFAPLPKGRNFSHPDPDDIAQFLARISVLAGTILTLIAAVAWILAFATSWRAHDTRAIAILLCPLFGLWGQIWYTWAYPVDWEGPIKGVLMQFAALPLCACVGLAISKLIAYRRWYARTAAAIGIASNLSVATYALYFRLWSPAIPVHFIIRG